VKILAIRGRNLASLAGAFEIDLETAPLAEAGLFAITGPTGAGKSTLLDALCLALYDRLPRLDGVAKSAVGRTDDENRLAGNDVRTILRHGAGDGFAEVDFVGRDGGRYRARWQVQRARKRAGSKVQDQVMTLTVIGSGENLGGTKTETLGAIRDKTGLDFDQFRRSVLLAQHDFDAFLKAAPKQRAALLELMTGTEIYSRLSVAAHERARDERIRLEAIEAEAGGITVLSNEDHATAMAARIEAEADLARLIAEVQRLTSDAIWHRRQAELAGSVGTAETALRGAEVADLDLQSERDRLANIRRAQACRDVVTQADRLTASVQGLTTRYSEANETSTQCANAAILTHEQKRTAHEAEEAAEAAFREAVPLLDQAASLDARVTAAAHQEQEAETTATAAAKAMAEATASLTRQTGQRDEVAARIGTINKWLGENGDRRELAEQIERWVDAITTHAQASEGLAAAITAQRRAEESAATLATERQAAEDRKAVDEPRLTELEKRQAALEADIGGIDGNVLETRRDGLTDLQAALADLGGSARTGEALALRRQAIHSRREEARGDLASATSTLAGIDTDRAREQAALDEARRALALAEAANGEHAAALRARLLDGQPCPVCGSSEHPVATSVTALTALLTHHRHHVETGEGSLRRLDDYRQETVAKQETARATLGQCETDNSGIVTEAVALQQAWGAAFGMAQAGAQSLNITLPLLPHSPEDKAARLGVAGAAEMVATALTEVRESLQILENLRRDRDQVARDASTLREAVGTAIQRLAEIALAQAGSTAEIGQAQRDQERYREAMQTAQNRLEVPLAVIADWPDRLCADSDDLIQTCRQYADEWRQHIAARDRQQEMFNSLEVQVRGATVAEQQAQKQAEIAGRRLEEAKQSHTDLLAQRATLFDGRPTAEIRSGLNAARLIRKDEHETACQKAATADAAVSAATATLTMLAGQLAEENAHRDEALAERDRQLAAQSLPLDQARELLAIDAAWIEAAEERVAASGQARQSAQAVLDERKRMAAEHEAAERPAQSAEDVAAALAAAEDAKEAANERQIACRRVLDDDQRNREQFAGLQERIQCQQGIHDRWKTISDLIGSADGAKFRSFAQGLTLDHLIVLANRHLADLTPRYMLERSPGGDLDLQVLDRDMGDEVRGVGNLSGGERFLVSLALALGLAGMSGHHALVESLFIDEGFGALDAHSLDIAISALEVLHASGRKVGVISHVQAMVDRIGVQVRVTKIGGGLSRVETVSA
jgi:DNA repair protein SbcC/Rad50